MAAITGNNTEIAVSSTKDATPTMAHARRTFAGRALLQLTGVHLRGPTDIMRKIRGLILQAVDRPSGVGGLRVLWYRRRWPQSPVVQAPLHTFPHCQEGYFEMAGGCKTCPTKTPNCRMSIATRCTARGFKEAAARNVDSDGKGGTVIGRTQVHREKS